MDIPTHYNYTVSVDEEARVAHALDERGAVLVSLDYSDEAELCSDEFQRCLSDAVALMHLDLGVKEEQCGGGDDVMMEIWREEMVAAGQSDRDFALALWEQEREEQMAAEEKKKKKKKESVWGTRMVHEDSALVAARETEGHGVSPESLKTMMAASSRSTSGKQEDTPNDSNYVDRERYSRKSIRKLVLDMIQAGWNPMPGRGGGHYMYERKVSVPGGSPITQILVIPSTPSSQKSIDRVYAKLMKCDREVSEKRMMMAKNASTQK
eukprot:jgi/Picre1/30670/NNA_006031.t1